MLERTIQKFIERLFLKTIEPFDKEDLEEAVEENISLLEQASEHRPGLLQTGRELARAFQGCGKYLTPQNVLIYLEEKRPDFYQKIEDNPKIMRWFRRQVSDFKRFFFGE